MINFYSYNKSYLASSILIILTVIIFKGLDLGIDFGRVKF